VVPAAGTGSRLGAGRPKLLVPVHGRPMIDRVMDLYRDYVAATVVIVAPAAADAVRKHVRSVPVDLAVQESPTGMLDAILLARDRVAASGAARVWVTWCDQIAIDPRTVATLAELSDSQPGAALVLPTVRRPAPYIHFVRDSDGLIVRVLQRREGDAMPATGESDAGLFSLSREAYLDALPEFAATIGSGSGTGERNFLPFIPWVARRSHVIAFDCVDSMEAIGVNTPEELRLVEGYLAKREAP
jgi:bifunctional UDP-N-acetylglucosamine pyrophosphorylase/glucosamine-1-phosphate N-acetyltransferase